MVTDDEEFCISAMTAMLKRNGINTDSHVDFCMNGQEALDTFIESYTLGFRYKMVFLDFSMPVMDGIEAASKIREFLAEQSVP